MPPVTILLVLSVASFAVPASNSTDQLIQRVENRYNDARTLSVKFVESYSIQGHPRRPESGTLTLRKQGKMRWDYARPEGKLFISDGKNVFLYTAWDNRVEKVPLKNTEDMRAPLAFLLGRLDMKKEFRAFHAWEGDGGTWLEASAANNRVPYQKIDMLIRPDASIGQLKIWGRDESLLDFTFDDERLNPPLNNDLFRFTIPPGAEVVDAIAESQEK